MCLTPMSIRCKDGAIRTVPCGHCSQCLNKFRLQWFIRLKEHKKLYDETIFATFTYNDENLRYGEGVEASLYPRDMQLYFKRLREIVGYKRFSYYMVGEYGTHTLRPHYHAVIFGLGRDFTVQVEKCWEYGFVHIVPVSDALLNYICKYHLLRGKAPVGCYPSFSRMSKNIGLSYVERTKKWHKKDIINRSFYWLEGQKFALPRYYRDKIFNKAQNAILKAHNEKLWHDKNVKESAKEAEVNYFKNKKYQIDSKNRRFKRKSEEGGVI